MNTSALNSEIEQEKERRLYSTPAKRLMEKLKPLASNVEAYQRRWFWELLQNACDYNDSVKIRVEVNKDRLRFMHNGAPFSTQDAMNLISPDSAKDEVIEDNTKRNYALPIGQFGTGFISTHILSYIIEVEGYIKQKDGAFRSFSYQLDREHYTDKAFLMKSIRASEKQLEDFYASDGINSVYSTKFSYDLSKTYSFVDSVKTVEVGLAFIEDAIPYVMAFMPKLEEVVIVRFGESLPVTIYRCNEEESDNEKVVTDIYKGINVRIANKVRSVHVLTKKQGNAIVAAQIEEKLVVEIPAVMPRLFCAYPMIGSESFPFPCIVNSTSFVPKTERDGIELSQNDLQNRKIIEDASTAFTLLIKKLCDDGYINIFNFCSLGKGNVPSTATNWYSNIIYKKLKVAILENKTIVTNEEERRTLKGTYVPYLPEKVGFEEYNTYYDKLSDYFLVPNRDEAWHWYQTLDFSFFTSEKLDLENALKIICKDNKTVESLKDSFSSDIDFAIGWLYNLVEYIIDSGQDVLLTKFALIPDQLGILHSLKDDLYWDNEIDAELKEIYLLLNGTDYRNCLLHQEFDKMGDKLSLRGEKGEQDICEAIDDSFREYGGSRQDKDFVTALEMTLNWSKDFTGEQLSDLFRWFSSQRATLFMEALISDDRRSLMFKMVNSDKVEILARIAESEISVEELEEILEHKDEFESFLRWKNERVDDETFADEAEGNIGEQVVYDFLCKKYKPLGYKVDWVSRDKNEPRYDFEISKNSEVVYFVDAKTTKRGIANSDSIPFFIRKRQWDFLPIIGENQRYLIARVFLGDATGPQIKLLYISTMNKN